MPSGLPTSFPFIVVVVGVAVSLAVIPFARTLPLICLLIWLAPQNTRPSKNYVGLKPSKSARTSPTAADGAKCRGAKPLRAF
ncbi:hypothetical protein DFH09DRAFT_1286123, partial [Mycena vulgaris]